MAGGDDKYHSHPEIDETPRFIWQPSNLVVAYIQGVKGLYQSQLGIHQSPHSQLREKMYKHTTRGNDEKLLCLRLR